MNELGDLLWTDARKEKYNVFSLPPKIRAQASSLGEISGDEDDVEVAISRIISRWQLLERRGTIGTLGVCALDSKARSKPISRLLEQISQNAEFDIIMFGDKNILDEPVENWPPCDFLISFFSGGFPLQKAIDYVTLRKPHCVNDLHMQMALRDRRVTLAFLDEIGVPTIERVEVNRDGDFAMPYAVLIRRVNSGSGLVTLEEDGDVLVVGVKRLRKPFVEKPVDSDDHNIYIYFSNDQGGGGRRLFRKTNNKSSEVDETLHVPRAITEPESSYIYEKFLEAENAEDVKAYTAGEFYCRAETRKAPIVDGVVKRNTHGKEIRYITSLSRDETRMASKIVQGFGQTVCGFGIIRSNGQSYVHSVSGWSLVKDNAEYSKNCAAVLRQLFIDETRNRELPRGLAKTFISRNVQSRSVQASFNKKLEWDLPELSTAPKGHEYNDLYPIQLRRHESRTLPGISKHFAPSSLRSPVTGSGGSKPSSLPSSRDIKYGHNSGLSSSGTSDKKSPMAWKLKGIVAVHSHGDSTPKQDLEFTFHTDPFIDLLEGHGNEVTLTKQSAITRLQSVADSALHVAAENADDLRKLNTALQKTVKEVKLSTKPTDFGSPPVPEQVNLVIHLGNDPTHALIYQTRELAENFRREFLLMNAELLGDLHVFCSSEAAASYTAHIFTARLLGFNDIPSDFIQERNDLLGDSLDATGQLETAQKQLNQLLREEMKPSAQSVWPLDMPEPSVVGKRLHQSIIANRTTVLLNFSKLNSANINLVQSRWCSGQDPYLFMDRWEKLLARICGAPRIDPAQIVELYNSLKFDAVHNREFLEWCFTPTDPTSSDSREDTMANYSTLHSRIPAPAQHQDNSLKRLHELWHLCKTMFDYIYPLKYGTTSGDKLEIGLLYSLPLLQEVVQDLEEMQASDDSKSFFYFTNNSHMYTLLNCILEGTLKSKMATNQIPTLDCLSSMCFELYERHSSNSREFEYSLKITLSPGCHAYDPLNTVVDSHHAIFSAPRRDLTGHIDWKEAIETLRVSIQRYV
ncbi:hypothetical protein BU16DRAFT_454830 [Lophium mytilinum]|uniref:Inositol hexakisphosphate and diphosphoinositol-pentakisphosphate kinase n=1 Tax=Lophium mytilinum TaxID=390894 RepID=A0A6A6R4K2_9PEZI|nr:hypothetical protein BU16DRAFT_454830 [Lophium mytilinum]